MRGFMIVKAYQNILARASISNGNWLKKPALEANDHLRQLDNCNAGGAFLPNVPAPPSSNAIKRVICVVPNLGIYIQRYPWFSFVHFT